MLQDSVFDLLPLHNSLALIFFLSVASFCLRSVLRMLNTIITFWLLTRDGFGKSNFVLLDVAE